MIKIKKGNTRIVFIFFRYLVIKVPNPRLDWYINSFKYGKKRILNTLKKTPFYIYEALLYGVIANLSEALNYVYSRKNAKYLTPTFTIGICNFQIYQGEDKPTPVEIMNLYENLPPEDRNWVDEAGCHEKSSDNWRKTKHGLRLVDFACDPLRTHWSIFLRGSFKELNKATTPKS